MKSIGVIVALCVLAVPVSLWLRARSRVGSPETSSPPLVIIEGEEKHRVTPEMAEAGLEFLGKSATSFSKTSLDGRVQSLDELVRRGPAVLTFIKKGCPCSEAAQPLFNHVKAAYPEVPILGVIDADVTGAKRWSNRFRAEYPLLPDPGLELMRAYGIQNSTYVVLIDSSSRIVGYWPGFSRDMLEELGRKLATLTGLPVRAFDVSDAPDELYSGCPFDL